MSYGHYQHSQSHGQRSTVGAPYYYGGVSSSYPGAGLNESYPSPSQPTYYPSPSQPTYYPQTHAIYPPPSYPSPPQAPLSIPTGVLSYSTPSPPPYGHVEPVHVPYLLSPRVDGRPSYPVSSGIPPSHSGHSLSFPNLLIPDPSIEFPLSSPAARTKDTNTTPTPRLKSTLPSVVPPRVTLTASAKEEPKEQEQQEQQEPEQEQEEPIPPPRGSTALSLDPSPSPVTPTPVSPEAPSTGKKFDGSVDDYKGVIALLYNRSFDKPCKEYLLNLCSEPGCGKFKMLVSECEKWIELKMSQPSFNPFKLDYDEVLALVAYSWDLSFNADPEENFFYLLNSILRTRSPRSVQKWSGCLYYLQSALSKLDDVKGTVYRGVTDLDVATKNYTIGRKIHWSAFSSTSLSLGAALEFAGPNGVVLSIEILNGKSIKDYSAYGTIEDEILLSPNMSFIVSKAITKRKLSDFSSIYTPRPPFTQITHFFEIQLVQIALDETFVF